MLDPITQQPLQWQQQHNQITIELPYLASPSHQNTLIEQLATTQQLPLTNIDCKSTIQRKQPANKTIAPLDNVANIIGISATKGGVGKSTIAKHLAITLAQLGGRVGLVDIDIFGPNQPQLLQQVRQKATIADNHYQPILSQGIWFMSMGCLVDDNAALIWRGPMTARYAEQLVTHTQWPALDYLIVDMPPGTGDVQLTLCQKIPLTSTCLVTTAHPSAIEDLHRGISMYRKLNIPMLGYVANMADIQCPACQHSWSPFGQHSLGQALTNSGLDLLATLPLTDSLQRLANQTPQPHSATVQQTLWSLAEQVSSRLSGYANFMPNPFPKIVVESS